MRDEIFLTELKLHYISLAFSVELSHAATAASVQQNLHTVVLLSDKLSLLLLCITHGVAVCVFFYCTINNYYY